MKVKCTICGNEYTFIGKKQNSTILIHDCKLYEVMYQQRKVVSIEVFE